LPLRQRWWRETDYGRRDAPLELVAAIADHVSATARACAKMLRDQEHPKFYSDSKAEWLASKAENDRFMAEMAKLGRLSEVSVSSDYDNNPWEQEPSTAPA
jgi:hypothetical protein